MKKTTMRELWDYVKLIIFVVVFVLLLNNFIIINAKIPSPSMEKTIMKGDQLFGNRLAYRFGDPKRLDIIIFKFPDDESQLFIKRVIGLPGDKIDIVDGKIYINDGKTALEENYLPEEMEDGTWGPYTVPEDSYFVLGDNRNDSRDSRYWQNTFVYKDQILGKAGLRYFPLNKIGFIK
jgi:signal peptidase I